MASTSMRLPAPSISARRVSCLNNFTQSCRMTVISRTAGAQRKRLHVEARGKGFSKKAAAQRKAQQEAKKPTKE
eukprot:scaffold103349_cov52-Prasinocladus_malaysianus.AAC.1